MIKKKYLLNTLDTNGIVRNNYYKDKTDTCVFWCHTEIVEDKIIYPCNKIGCNKIIYLYFDLENSVLKKMLDKEKYNVNGVLSPDKTKGLEYNHITHEIELYSTKDTISLGKYYTDLDEMEAGHGTFPILWLDNNSFLTQSTNGEIIKVNLNGIRKSIVKIKITKKGSYAPILFKDKSGNIFYYFVYNKKIHLFKTESFKSNFYKIDLEKKTYELSSPIEDGFSYTFRGIFTPKTLIMYNSQKIGKFKGYYHPKINYNYIAFCTQNKKGYTINVWNKFTQEWWKSNVLTNKVKLIGWRELYIYDME